MCASERKPAESEALTPTPSRRSEFEPGLRQAMGNFFPQCSCRPWRLAKCLMEEQTPTRWMRHAVLVVRVRRRRGVSEGHGGAAGREVAVRDGRRRRRKVGGMLSRGAVRR
eukprot:5580453-Pleurochrysis_carterae.AAC.1